MIAADKRREWRAPLRKSLFLGSVVMALATAAAAGERYVEIWNPPEARNRAHELNSQARKPIKRRHVNTSVLRTLPPTAKHRASATAFSGRPPAIEPRVRPTFDDIPRRITPEGNISRVSHGTASIDRHR
jgi:hypothetical protein